jgi:hypothetical protein
MIPLEINGKRQNVDLPGETPCFGRSETNWV